MLQLKRERYIIDNINILQTTYKYSGGKRMNISIRDVDPVAIKKIDELAKKKGISRNEYLQIYIQQIAIVKDINEIEEKYTNLIDVLTDRLEQANDVIQENSLLIKRLINGEH